MDSAFCYDIVVIGGGPVGIFTVFQAGMLGMKCCVIESKHQLGGQCSELYPEKPIYDIPGFVMVTGQELIDKLVEQAKPFAPEYILGKLATEIEKLKDGSFQVFMHDGTFVHSKSIIVATGAGAFVPRKPDVEHINEFEGKSVFYKVSDKKAFADKKIAIAGGGDSAVDWALELPKVAKEVFIFHRKNKFSCMPNSMQKLEQLSSQGEVSIVTPYTLQSLIGKSGKLESLKLKNSETGEIVAISVDILLILYGFVSDPQFINKMGIEHEKGKVLTDRETFATSREGIFAAGDALNYRGRQKLILIGFAEIAIACYHIYKSIYPEGNMHAYHSTKKGIPAFR